MTQRFPRLLAATAVALVAALAVPAGANPGNGKARGHTKQQVNRPPAFACTGDPAAIQTLNITVGGTPTFGYYALPTTHAKGLVVFAHGYGHTVESWRRHLTRTASELGVIAVAMEYRGQTRVPPANPGDLPGSRGWQVQEGAEDSVAAAQYLDSTCRIRGTSVLYGVSMGGNTSGLALAMRPKAADGSPLFDYWVAVEGAHNVIETYHEALAVAGSGNEFAVNAVEDIEREMGGTFLDRHEVYADRTVVNRVDDIAGAGLKAVILVHGVGDGLVPYNQSRELYLALRGAGVPVGMTTFALKSETSESGTTLDGYVPVPHDSPFAGHASEASETHDVGNHGFAELAAIFDGSVRCGERLVPSEDVSVATSETC